MSRSARPTWSPRRLLNGVRRRARRLVRRARQSDGPQQPSTPTPAGDPQVRRLRQQIDALRTAGAADERNALEYSFAYRQVASAADGIGAWRFGPADATAPSRAEALGVRRQILGQRRRATLAEALALGHSIEQATTEYVRNHFSRRERIPARTMCEGLRLHASTRAAGDLGCALIAHSLTSYGKAWSHFRDVPEEHWRRWAPVEYVDAAFICDPEHGTQLAEHLLALGADDMSAAGWLALARRTFAARRYDLARDAASRAAEIAAGRPGGDDDAPDAGVDGDDGSADERAGTGVDAATESAWLLRWIDTVEHPQPPIDVAPGSVPVAVVDYKLPDVRLTSRNVGDYVQTLASLGHLVRRRGLTFSGPDDLAALAGRLRERVPEDRRLDGPPADVTLVPVDRDASHLGAIPDGTWVIAFGWYMHPYMSSLLDFPFHAGLRPIFVSFHCRRRHLLTPEAIDYLRRHGPIGCRDWNTVNLLLSVDVPAFFSGCITTTVGTLFPSRRAGDADDRDLPTAYVDAAVPRSERSSQGVEVIEHSSEAIRHGDLVTNLDAATRLLERYRSDIGRVVTSRLHCYLPVRALGTPVDFVPANPADVRFNGLVDLDDEALGAMRDGIDATLASVIERILAGASEDDVYAHWRELCAEDVAAARARFGAVPPIAPPTFDVPAACGRIRSEEVTIPRSEPSGAGGAGGEVDIAMALDGNLKRQLEVVVEAITANTRRPIHLWILCRDHDTGDFARFAELFPDVSCTWLPCDHVDYGDVVGMVAHTTVSTLDRLLLPELLPELDRIVYLDIDILPLADVGELYDWDLRGKPGAARSTVAARSSSGYEHNVERPANRLRRDPEAANDLYLRMFARHPYDFPACNAGVLVLDLARMRADRFVRHHVPFVERYGMNDQETLNCYFGADRATLPPEWNHLLVSEHLEHPKLIHWAGSVKPWDEGVTPYQDRWRHHQAGVEARRASTTCR